jgi:hypothetical protein
MPGESPQAAYLRMLGERESNVVVKRADMTPEQLQGRDAGADDGPLARQVPGGATDPPAVAACRATLSAFSPLAICWYWQASTPARAGSLAARARRSRPTPVNPPDVASGQGWWNLGQRPQPIAPAPVSPTMPRVSCRAVAAGGEPGACAGPHARRLGRHDRAAAQQAAWLERLRL